MSQVSLQCSPSRDIKGSCRNRTGLNFLRDRQATTPCSPKSHKNTRPAMIRHPQLGRLKYCQLHHSCISEMSDSNGSASSQAMHATITPHSRKSDLAGNRTQINRGDGTRTRIARLMRAGWNHFQSTPQWAEAVSIRPIGIFSPAHIRLCHQPRRPLPEHFTAGNRIAAELPDFRKGTKYLTGYDPVISALARRYVANYTSGTCVTRPPECLFRRASSVLTSLAKWTIGESNPAVFPACKAGDHPVQSHGPLTPTGNYDIPTSSLTDWRSASELSRPDYPRWKSNPQVTYILNVSHIPVLLRGRMDGRVRTCRYYGLSIAPVPIRLHPLAIQPERLELSCF